MFGRCHIVCADSEQAKSEIGKALDLIEYMAGVFGLKMGEDYSYRLSLGDRNDKKSILIMIKLGITRSLFYEVCWRRESVNLLKLKERRLFMVPK